MSEAGLEKNPGRSLNLRAILSALALVLLVAGGVQPFYFRVFALDRTRMREHLTELPYRKLPGFRQFLLRVHDSTASGDSVGLWLDRSWKQGYEYGHQRSAYLLPGRELLPLIDSSDRLLRENLVNIDYLACWRCEPSFKDFEVVRRFPEGTLAKRR